MIALHWHFDFRHPIGTGAASYRHQYGLTVEPPSKKPIGTVEF